MNQNPAFDGTSTSALSPASIFQDVFKLIETYRRYVRAGLEIEALLSMSDTQLAAHHLSRGQVGPKILAKHGIDLGAGHDHQTFA